MSIRWIVRLLLAAGVLALSLTGEGPSAGMEGPGAGTAYVESDAPATVSLVYDADGAVAAVRLTAPGALRLRLERKPAQVVVDGKALAEDAWRWEDGRVSLSLDAGEHRVELNLAPREVGADPPAVTLEVGRARVAMAVTHGRERMVAAGEFAGATGRYRVRSDGWSRPVRVASGGDAVVCLPGGEAPELLLMQGATVSATLEGRHAPRKLAVKLEQLSVAVTLRAEASPAQQPPPGILVEAEAFVRQGGGEVVRSGGEHAGTHGGDSIYYWGPAGHWLEWDVSVPIPGRYRVTLAAAGQHPEAFVGLAVDGREPFTGAGFLCVPGTGGWGRTDPAQWRLFRVAGAGKAQGGVVLDQGKHTLRLTNVQGVHLNLDYLVLVPEP